MSGWAILAAPVCSIIDVVGPPTRVRSTSACCRAGGLLGFVLGSPLAWGLSKVFAVIVFVVVGLFSLLMITRTHVTPGAGSRPHHRCHDIAAFLASSAGAGFGTQQDQFPNEVRVGDGDETLAFAEGVPRP